MIPQLVVFAVVLAVENDKITLLVINEDGAPHGSFLDPVLFRKLTGFASFLPLCDEATTAKYWITFLVFSVLPAPDSPLGVTRETCLLI